MSRAYSSYLQAASSLALEERRADNDLPESLVQSNRIQFMHANPTANAKHLDTAPFGGSLQLTVLIIGVHSFLSDWHGASAVVVLPRCTMLNSERLQVVAA